MTADRKTLLEYVRELATAPPGTEFAGVVCVRCDDDHPLIMLDNEVGDCSKCGCRVQFRPDVPPVPRICIPCALALVDKPL